MKTQNLVPQNIRHSLSWIAQPEDLLFGLPDAKPSPLLCLSPKLTCNLQNVQKMLTYPNQILAATGASVVGTILYVDVCRTRSTDRKKSCAGSATISTKHLTHSDFTGQRSLWTATKRILGWPSMNSFFAVRTHRNLLSLTSISNSESNQVCDSNACFIEFHRKANFSFNMATLNGVVL